MNRKAVSGITLTLLLIVMSTITFGFQSVEPEQMAWTVDGTLFMDFRVEEVKAISSSSDTYLFVYPHITWTWPGQTFKVDIRVCNVIDLELWQIKLYFDGSILTCLDVIVSGLVKITPDYVLVGGGYYPPFTGNCTLCQIIFEAVTEGISPLHFSEDQTYLPGSFYTIDGIAKVVQHEIVLTRITPHKNVLSQGYSTSINVTIENKGNFTENFNVTAYADTTIIDTLTNITAASVNFTTVTFLWNTAGVTKRNYTISANATILPGETDTTDNTLTNGWILVTVPGDVNGDRMVDMADKDLINNYFGEPCSTYPNADVNCDCSIDMADIDLFNFHFGESW